MNKKVFDTMFDSVISYDEKETSVGNFVAPTQLPRIDGMKPIDFVKPGFGGRADRKGGAIANQIAQFVSSGVNAIPLNDSCSIVLKSGGPSRHVYVSAADMLYDMRIAVQNFASKITASSIAEIGFDTEIDLVGKTVGGWFHVANTFLDSDMRPYELILESTSSGDTIIYEVYPTKPQQQFMMLFPSNNGGIALVTGIEDLLITVPADELSEGTVVAVQSINARDIM
jgi:hypothetical protein